MAYQTGEIITVQSGHYANYVGSHWWNLQQASFCFDPRVPAEDNCVNHDVLFREGKTLLGEFTFTPRLISFDLKQSMGTLRKEGILYELRNQPINIPWQEQLVVEQGDKVTRNTFLKDLAVEEGLEVDETEKNADDKVDVGNGDDLENTEKDMDNESLPACNKYNLDDCVNVWSDFLKVHFHPKTMCLIDNPIADDIEDAADSIILGQSLSKGPVADEIEDKIHFFSEECDHLQAFQLFMDPYDRFAGITDKVLEIVADDFSSKSVLCFGVTPTTYKYNTPIANKHRVLSSLIALTSVHEHTSLLVPVSCAQSPWLRPEASVSVPYLDYKSNLNYHTSAILAAVLDTATLPLRSKTEPVHVRDLCSSLQYGGRKIAAVVGALPLALSRDRPLLDYLMGLEGLPWQSFSSLGPKSLTTDPQVQQLVVRGATGPLMRNNDAKNLPRMLSHCDDSGQLLGLYLKDSMSQTRSYSRSFNPAVNTRDPFPHIFTPEIGANGTLGSDKRSEDLLVESVPAIGGLQSHPATGEYLKTLVNEAKTINLKRMTGFFDQTFETDDFNECVENLLTLIEDYPMVNDSESDSDNDDA